MYPTFKGGGDLRSELQKLVRELKIRDNRQAADLTNFVPMRQVIFSKPNMTLAVGVEPLSASADLLCGKTDACYTTASDSGQKSDNAFIIVDSDPSATFGYGEVNPKIQSSSTETQKALYLQTVSGVPGLTTWASGDWVVNFTLAGTSTTMTWEDTYICRIDTNCTGYTLVGSASDQGVALTATGTISMTVSGGTVSTAETDTIYIICGFGSTLSGGVDEVNITGGSVITTPLQENPGAKARYARVQTDQGLLFLEDSGSGGKQQFVVMFDDGSTKVLATQA